MNAERFQMLIETLERPRPPEIKWDMRTWGSPTYVDGYLCGTAACAAGLYVMDHPDEDLKYDQEHGDVYVGLNLHDPGALPGLQACAQYWGITRREATFLFSPGGYGRELPTKAQVLDRIRNFYEKRINADDCITNA